MEYIPLLSNVSFGLPLLLFVAASIAWWWSTRPMPPPSLDASPPYHSWRINPVAAAYTSLSQERYLLAAFLLRERFAQLVQEQFGVPPEDLRSWASSRDAPALPPPLNARRVLRDLTDAYRSAYVAEMMQSWEVFSGALMPMRRRRAARDFARASREVDQVVEAWGSAA